MKYLCLLGYLFLSLAQAGEEDSTLVSTDTLVPMSLSTSESEEDIYTILALQETVKTLEKQIKGMKSKPFWKSLGKENKDLFMKADTDPEILYNLLEDNNFINDSGFYTKFIEAFIFDHRDMISASDLLGLLTFTVNWEKLGKNHPEGDAFKLKHEEVGNLLEFVNPYRFSLLFSCRGGATLLEELALRYNIFLSNELSLTSAYLSFSCDPLSAGLVVGSAIGGIVPYMVTLSFKDMTSFFNIGLPTFFGVSGGVLALSGLWKCCLDSLYGKHYQQHWPTVYERHEAIDNFKAQLRPLINGVK